MRQSVASQNVEDLRRGGEHEVKGPPSHKRAHRGDFERHSAVGKDQ